MLLQQFLSMKLPFQWGVVGSYKTYRQICTNLVQYISMDEKISLFTAKEGDVFIRAASDSTIPPKILDNCL